MRIWDELQDKSELCEKKGIIMNNIKNSSMDGGLPLTEQECLQESWEQVQKDAELMEIKNED